MSNDPVNQKTEHTEGNAHVLNASRTEFCMVTLNIGQDAHSTRWKKLCDWLEGSFSYCFLWYQYCKADKVTTNNKQFSAKPERRGGHRWLFIHTWYFFHLLTDRSEAVQLAMFKGEECLRCIWDCGCLFSGRPSWNPPCPPPPDLQMCERKTEIMLVSGY